VAVRFVVVEQVGGHQLETEAASSRRSSSTVGRFVAAGGAGEHVLV
jgi:hypothetical protein